jgi:hypothetical protein
MSLILFFRNKKNRLITEPKNRTESVKKTCTLCTMMKRHNADCSVFGLICAFCISAVSVYLQLSIVTDTCTLVNVIRLYVYDSLFLCPVLFDVFCSDTPAFS